MEQNTATDNKDEVIAALQEKIAQLGSVIEEVVNAPKSLGKITAGPITDNDKTFYRAEVGGNSILVVFSKPLFFAPLEEQDLPIGTEVVIQGGAITAINPPDLQVIEELPRFKLVKWDEIGGLKSQMEDIRDAIELPLHNAELAAELGMAPMKGILLYGPPGCGKTLIAKAIASTILKTTEADARAFVYVKGAEILDKYVGATEARIVNMFAKCREYTRETGQRAIIFIDEAEAILAERGGSHHGASFMSSTVVPTFLAEMDGFEGDNPFVLLSTNLPSNIDPAILREGRIDLKVEIKRPTAADLPDIFQIHLKNVKCHEKIEELACHGTDALVKHPAFVRISGSMVETVVKFSAQKAMKRKIKDAKTPSGIIQEDVTLAAAMLN